MSNDNAYAESVLRTLKYRPQWPSKGFKDLADVRQWVERFVHWYNHEHKHSKIRFVTPHQRYSGQGQQILDSRKAVLEKARNKTHRAGVVEKSEMHRCRCCDVEPRSGATD